MSDEAQRGESAPDRWRTLPPRTPLHDLVTGQEVPPKPQVIADADSAKVDEATRYPA
ncbi:hypothetical protein [Actinomadura algeriensis]|uniref:Uncharacterized protein n=1 Tax=Actinomadura algeriensis TaxID=1679523 RepID=A0ABR9JLR3_9ACTN|nr:hypothetical protein [Actinomadura algeriensis]MBE1531374.1 hypothetical protein [Actinomadura algeriensis]